MTKMTDKEKAEWAELMRKLEAAEHRMMLCIEDPDFELAYEEDVRERTAVHIHQW